MLSLEQISTLINGLKSWVLNEIKKSKADLGPLADEFVSFKEQVQDTIDNAALKPMVVMSKDGTLEANYNSSEIYNYVTSGGTAVFKFESEILPLVDFDETFSAFLFTTNNGNFISTRAFIVYEDGHIEAEDEFSNTVRIVNLSDDGTASPLGPKDIIDIANSGRLVLLEYNGDYYNLAEKSSEDNPYPIVTFQKWFYYESELRIVSIDIDYNHEVNINFHDPLNIGVSSVNGQSGEVELTAEDVGALTEEDLSEMGFLTSEDAVADSPVPFDADTLNGYDSEYFASKEYVDEKYQKTILAPATAEVGQTIRVSEVDENGKPTAWEAAPSGKWRYIGRITTEEDVTRASLSVDSYGKPFSLSRVLIQGRIAPNNHDATGYVKPVLSGKWWNAVAVYGVRAGEGIIGNGFRYELEIIDGRVFGRSPLKSVNSSNAWGILDYAAGTDRSVDIENMPIYLTEITSVGMQGWQEGTIGAGSYFDVWGIDL